VANIRHTRCDARVRTQTNKLSFQTCRERFQALVVKKIPPSPSKARLTKNLWTNPEIITSCFRVNWVWSEWVNLYNQHMILLMLLFVQLPLYAPIFIYRVIHKSFRDFRPLQYSSRDGHAEGEHVNRGRDTQVSVLPYRCSVCLPCCVCLGCCAAEFGSSGGTYELPCTYYSVPLVP